MLGSSTLNTGSSHGGRTLVGQCTTIGVIAWRSRMRMWRSSIESM
jgi:hypothetical protein